MNIGFIGAGKVGFSFGKYLSLNQHFLSGYYSKNLDSALEAGKFTNSLCFDNLYELIKKSDIILITVPDGQIKAVAQEIATISGLDFSKKFFGHCSGAFNHTILSDLKSLGAYTFSLHPFLAISDKYKSYRDFSNAFFTIEGDEMGIKTASSLVKSLGNHYKVIDSNCKPKYHTAAVFATNLMVGLCDMASDLLMDCGFSKEEASLSLSNILRANLENVIQKGSVNALTGPVERNDEGTVITHLNCLSNREDYSRVYKDLSLHLIEIAKIKHPDRDYSDLEEKLMVLG